MMEERLMTVNGDTAGLSGHGALSWWRAVPRIGLTLTACASLLTATAHVLTTDVLLPTVSPSDIMLGTHCAHALVVIPYVSHIRNEIDVTRTTWKFISLSGALQALTVASAVSAISLAPRADVFSLIYCQVLVVAATAWYLLGEKPTPFDAVTAVITAAGVVLAARPGYIFGGAVDDTMYYVGGMLYALAALITVSLSNMVVRHVRESPTSVVVAVQSIVTVVVALVMVIKAGQMHVPATVGQTFALVAVAGFTLVARLAIVTALKTELALHVSAFVALELPFKIFITDMFHVLDLAWIQSLGISIIFIVAIIVFSEKFIRHFFKNMCGCNVATYEQVHNYEVSEEQTALKETNENKDFPSLYTLD